MLIGSRAADIQGGARAAGFLPVPAFVLTLLVEEVPLRAQGGLAAAHADADERAHADRSDRDRRPVGG